MKVSPRCRRRSKDGVRTTSLVKAPPKSLKSSEMISKTLGRSAPRAAAPRKKLSRAQAAEKSFIGGEVAGAEVTLARAVGHVTLLRWLALGPPSARGGD